MLMILLKTNVEIGLRFRLNYLSKYIRAGLRYVFWRHNRFILTSFYQCKGIRTHQQLAVEEKKTGGSKLPRKLKPTAVNYRMTFWSFTSVFQLKHMCEQQFS